MNYYKFNVVFVFTIKGTKEEVQTAEKQFISGVYTPECLRETHHSRDKPEPQKRKIESNDSQDKPKSKKAKIQSKDILDKSKQKKTQKVKGKENKPPKTSNISTIKILSVSELSLPPSPSIPQTSNPAVPQAPNPAPNPAYLGHLRKAIPVYGRTPRYSLDIFSLSLCFCKRFFFKPPTVQEICLVTWVQVQK